MEGEESDTLIDSVDLTEEEKINDANLNLPTFGDANQKLAHTPVRTSMAISPKV